MIDQPVTYPPRTVSLIEPARPRRRGRACVTPLGTRRDLRAPAPPQTVGSVEVAPADAERCEHRTGTLRCVRAPHADAPRAHVMLAGAPDAAPLGDAPVASPVTLPLAGPVPSRRTA